MIVDYCRSADDWFYVEDAVQEVGLAYQTTVRYLQYLIAKDELQVVSDYGKVGRPRNKYKLKAISRKRLEF
jgi:two-component system response regulator DctR